MIKASGMLAALLILLASCASKKKINNAANADGSSYEKAILINETSENKGVGDEYAWIRKNYPGAKTNSQALTYHDKKPYDILHFTTADGIAMTVYFDISLFYGKF